MLDTLITSKTRLKMLLKFFTNSASSAYLRGMAEEFGESTNAIRHELNNLSKAGYLISSEEGRTILYRANTAHPLFKEVKNLVHKYLGIDEIIENVVKKLGDLKSAYIIGDYAKGKDSGTIELLLIGHIDTDYLLYLVARAKGLIKRDIVVTHMEELEFEIKKEAYNQALLVWGEGQS
ncbi:MAG: winged helix-turn-helix transcriptional regulator [Cyclobacteriaceae bacterium]|nr:winged helix-turn-helix transcriptional regulator [Cyclobacteriaceae bacterium]